MTPAVLAVLVAALVAKLIDLAKYIRARHTNAVVTQLVAFVVGILSTFAASAQSLLGSTTFNGATLQSISGIGKVLIGLLVAAVASHISDFKGALDNSDSQATPPLVEPAVPAPNYPPNPRPTT